MPRNVIAGVPSPSSNRICCFCGLGDDNELDYGKFHEYDGIVTHYYCLLLSSNMQQKGRDDEGILGFLPDDINKELRRGKRLACCFCRKTGATLGCCNTKCKKIFHFPCGLKSGSLHQFFGEFRSYCKNHRPKQKIDDRVSEEVKKRDNMICYICYDEVNPHDMYNTLWAPCCKKNAWFHRTCVQQLAMSAGYFFKCPLCNNKTEFQRAMLDHGIFIPSQDASWELVPNAFEELLYRHNRCDADNCLCPKGREHTSTNAKWELTLCRTCGSQGIHMACGQLKWVKPIWECSECTSILNKSATSDSESSSVSRASRERRRLRREERLLIDDGSSDSDISVGTEATVATTSESSSLMTQEDETRKSLDEPVALRITRRSIIPIPKSPVNTKIQTPKAVTTIEDLPPEPKRPRFSECIVQRNRRESIDSDDDIMVISGPSRSQNSASNERKSPVQCLSINNSWSVNTNVQIEDPNLREELQQPKKSDISSSILYETLFKSQPVLRSRVSTETEKRVVEIDLSEAECTIPTTVPTNSIVNEIPAVSSVADPPQLNIMITNVTSLAPEAFDNVPEQKFEVKNESTKVPTRTSIFNESNGGLTPQTPIVLDDEPLPVAPTNPVAGNNNLHFPSIGMHDQIKIVRFDGATDAFGNPTNTVLYGITIVGTNQILPLIFTATENSNSNATSALHGDVNKPIAISSDCNSRNENQPSRPGNNSSSSSPANVTTSLKSDNHQIASTTTPIRSVVKPIAPKASASSLSLSVPLRAVVNERFSTSRTVRKSIDKSSIKTVTVNNQSSLIKTPGALIAPNIRGAVGQAPLITLIPKDSVVKMPGGPIFPKTPVAQPKAPMSNGFDASVTPKTPLANAQANKNLSNCIDATMISKMFALMPPDSFPASQAKSTPSGIISSTTPRIGQSVFKEHKITATNVNSNFPNVNTNGLNSHVTSLNTDAADSGATTANFNSSKQLQIEKSADNKQQIIEPQLYQRIRSDQNNAFTDDCDGAAGSGPAVQPASAYNPRNAKSSRPTRQATASPCQRVPTLQVGNRSTHERSSDAEGADTDDAAERPSSSNRSHASNRTGLIYKSINLRDLKFSTCGSNIVKMTLYDTFSVNIKLDSSNPCKKYSSLRRTTKCSSGREAKARDIGTCDAKDVSNSLNPLLSSDIEVILNQPESTSQDDASTPESVNQTNDFLSINVASRGQDELKENLDPIPPSTNSNHNATNTVDRKCKLRLRSGVNHSMRYLNEKEGQQISCDKHPTPKKVAPTEPKSIQNHSKILYNGWKDSACHEEANAENVLLDRCVETVANSLIPCSSVNDNSAAEDSDQIHASKRKRISVNDENLGEMRNFMTLTTTKEPIDCNYTNVNDLINGAGNLKRKWSSCDDVSRSKKFHVNTTIDDRECASSASLNCKVSIDLTKIRAVLAAKLNVSDIIVDSEFGRRSVAPDANETDDNDVSDSKSVASLSKSRSFDNLTFDPGEDSIIELRKSKSFDDLSSLSFWSYVDNAVEKKTRGCKRKMRSFEKHDCVR